jgi:hypothetical protein
MSAAAATGTATATPADATGPGVEAEPVWRRRRLTSSTAAATAAATECDCEPEDDFVRVFAMAPALDAVIHAAHRAAGLDHDPGGGWRVRSRVAALVPWLTVRAGNSESWRSVTDPTISYAASAGIALAWRLDRLVYDPNEPRFRTLDLQRRRERRRLALIVNRAYFAWVEAAAAAEHDIGWLPRLHQAHADLDALTDGWFSLVALR